MSAATISTELTPARTELSRTIDLVAAAMENHAKAQIPLRELERIRAAATVGEANELRAALQRLRHGHTAAVDRWVEGGAVGPRPPEPDELADMERRLAEIAAAATEAAPRLAIAEEGVASAAARLRQAGVLRDQAIAPAAAEAAEPILTQLIEAIGRVVKLEEKARGLVEALREIGNRGDASASGYFAAAERVENRINSLRRGITVATDLRPAQRLLETLKVDARAAF